MRAAGEIQGIRPTACIQTTAFIKRYVITLKLSNPVSKIFQYYFWITTERLPGPRSGRCFVGWRRKNTAKEELQARACTFTEAVERLQLQKPGQQEARSGPQWLLQSADHPLRR